METQVSALATKVEAEPTLVEWLKTTAACKELNICRQTLYTWHKKGILVPDSINPHSKLRKYSRKQIEEFKQSFLKQASLKKDKHE